jgi:hypothetical protein
MSTNGQLVFTDVDKITFKGVGNTSNAVVDTVTGKIGVGVDNPDANLHVLGNSYVSTNLELGGTLIMGTVNVSAHHSLEAVTATGNTTPLTVEFQNADTSLVASGNVEVGTANLFVDTVNSMVGIRTTSPSFPLSVSDASVKKWNAFNNNTSAGDYTFTKSGIYLVGFMYGDGSDGNTCEYYTITAATSHGVNCGVTQHKNASSGYLNYAVQDHDTVRFWASSLPAGFNTSNYHLRIYFAGYS